MDMRDLALEAAFTSMSLRERWRAPGVEDTLELITLPEEMLHTHKIFRHGKMACLYTVYVLSNCKKCYFTYFL